jgi:nitroreductase
MPRPAPPWDVWDFSPRLHPVLFVHRVEGLAPGLYVLVRDAAAEDRLRRAMNPGFTWTRPAGCPEHLPFFQLAAAACGPIAKAINCHQAIAADSTFALGMVSEFEPTVTATPWRYRQLHWEAGLLGQVLYLEAERRGLRGTGIGCYFDDQFHGLLGLSGTDFQSLYHFTVGCPVTDTRILTLPPYPERQ